MRSRQTCSDYVSKIIRVWKAEQEMGDNIYAQQPLRTETLAEDKRECGMRQLKGVGQDKYPTQSHSHMAVVPDKRPGKTMDAKPQERPCLQIVNN